MSDILADIAASHRRRVAEDPRSPDDLMAQASARPPTRGFAQALARDAAGGLAVISEFKRRSPSAGDLGLNLLPAAVAGEYVQGGTSCISVLTDEDFFAGSMTDLAEVASATSVPVLRKDFTVSATDVYDARIGGADAVLLIVGILSDSELVEFHARASDVGLGVLVEVFDEAELERAEKCDPKIVGINQRNLRDFSVESGRAAKLREAIGAAAITVCESGVRTVADAIAARQAGFDGILVGEALIKSENRPQLVREMRQAV